MNSLKANCFAPEFVVNIEVAFLCYRQQRNVINGVKSDWYPVVSGVPQGTVPLVFSLYLNDITADIV